MNESKIISYGSLISLLLSLTLGIATVKASVLGHNDCSDLFINDIYIDSSFVVVQTGVINLGHGTVSFGDYDNDADLDILVTGIGGRDSSNTDDPSPHISKIFRNDSGQFVDIHADLIGVNNNEGTIWCDYDNDGDLDLFLGGGTREPNADPCSKIYRNDSGTFVDQDVDLPGLVGTASWADFDNDMDLDLFICGSPDNGTTFRSYIFENNSGAFININAGIIPVWGASAAWGDFDEDGDLDLLITGWAGFNTTKMYRNDSGDFVDTYIPFRQVAAGQVKWGDFDGDHDLDIILTGSYETLIYRNEGSGVFEEVQNSLPGLAYSTQAWGDYDNDGDLDIVLSGEDGSGNLITRIYRNDNTSFINIGSELVGMWYCSVEWGDFDKDGDLDLLTSGFTHRSGIWPYKPATILYENRLNVSNSQPFPPPTIDHEIIGGKVILKWTRGSDNETPRDRLSYNIFISSSPEVEDVVSSMADKATGYRKVPREGNIRTDTSWSGSFIIPGTYYWSVQSIDNVYAGSQFALIDSFIIVGTPHTCFVNGEWNLLSLPISTLQSEVARLFPQAISKAYTYGNQYDAQTNVYPNQGFWLKFPTPTEIHLSGLPIMRDTIDVKKGWNLIGSLSQSVPISSVIALPSDLLSSDFFGYSGGYDLSASIEPFKAYWVKCKSQGKLILDAISHGTSYDPPVENLSSILIEDPNNHRQRLYFGLTSQAKRPLTNYEMPPKAPFSLMDCRYQSNRIAEFGDGIQPGLFPIELLCSRYPIRISWTCVDKKIDASLIIDGDSIDLSNEGSYELNRSPSSVIIRVESRDNIVRNFSLHQNYPNPFNPTTIISYDLPSESRIKLTLFNALGSIVDVLAEGVQQIGNHELVWNAAHLSSGFYYCRLDAANTYDVRQSYSQTMKLLLLK